MLRNVTLTEPSCWNSGVHAQCLLSILQAASLNTVMAITRRAIKRESLETERTDSVWLISAVLITAKPLW